MSEYELTTSADRYFSDYSSTYHRRTQCGFAITPPRTTERPNASKRREHPGSLSQAEVEASRHSGSAEAELGDLQVTAICWNFFNFPFGS